MEKNLRIDAFFGRIIELLFNPISYFGATMAKLKECIKIKLKVKSSKEKNKSYSNIIRGVLITIPIVIFIVILLSSADEVFRNIFIKIFDSILNITGKIKLSNIGTKIIVIVSLFLFCIDFWFLLIKRNSK